MSTLGNNIDHILGRVIKYASKEDAFFTGRDLEYVSSIFLGRESHEYQHLYIISDDPIEIGDRYIIEDDEDDDIIYHCVDNSVWPDGKRSKLIKTTHQGLGVDMIDPEEIEKYLDFLSQ